MRMPTSLVAVALLLPPTLGTVAAMDTPDAPLALEGTSWQLTSLPGRTLLANHAATLQFDEGRVLGTDGCNRYTGPCTADAMGFRLSGALAATKVACPPPVMEQADAFLAALAATRAVRREGDELTLLDAQGAVLATLRAQSLTLPASAWRVTGYNNGKQAVVSVLSDSTLTMEFSTDGKVGGSAGCNRYTATYAATGRGLSIGPAAATKKMCARPEGVMEQEAAFLKALEGVAVARIDGDRLELRSAAGSLMVSARRESGDAEHEGATPASGTAAPSDASPTLGGEMRCMADAARFTECRSGRSYPIGMEGDFIRAERAYREARGAPGAPLYVTFDGSIVSRPRMEGDGTEPTVVIDRFIHAWPGQTCERARADASLTNTYWRIVRLGDRPVSTVDGLREPHLVLRAEGDRTGYAATVGCNQVVGGCAIDGGTIRFSPGAATLMACPPPLDELERALGEALEKARRWHITASTLEFFDESGASVALFESVYL